MISEWSRECRPSSATYWRLRQGREPLLPHAALGHAANFLYMLDGQEPESERVRALETYLNTVIDHGLNASTFTVRVITSTGSDLVSAIVGGLGALKGPLHGGAPGPALDMVFEIGDPARAEAVLRAKIEAGERLMGFGHRVYKVRDPVPMYWRRQPNACSRTAATGSCTRWLAPWRLRRSGCSKSTSQAAGCRPTWSSTPRCCCTASASIRRSSRRRLP